MASEEKPYRVYRGGRTKGKVPAPPRPERAPRKTDGDDVRRYRGPSGGRPARPGRRRRLILLGVLVFFLLGVVWMLASYFAFRGGVSDANKRLDANAKLALNDQSGLLLSHPTTILLLGTDHAQIGGREGDRHSDSIMLIRADPDKHRLTYLSIPRDLFVEIPGHGPQKINAAFQIGGPALAMRAIRTYTGLDINHVVLVDFADFKDLIDALGGVRVDVPKPILSNRFDCPYPTSAQCQRWQGWRFHKGEQEMSGSRALIYSRIRENRLDPSENDLTRTARQQAVVEAIQSKLTSPLTLLKMPFVGGKLVKPVATDLSTGEFIQLGWMKFRAARTVHCHLGGTFASSGGASVIEPAEENRNVIGMFLGLSAPQPSPPGAPTLPGCTGG
jgi:polyisoprenyl-teichoic acid--peptidoglycan teichoic acid transferase